MQTIYLYSVLFTAVNYPPHLPTSHTRERPREERLDRFTCFFIFGSYIIYIITYDVCVIIDIVYFLIFYFLFLFLPI